MLVAASIVAVAVVALLLANTADSGHKKKPKVAKNNQTPALRLTAPLKLQIGTVVVQNAGPPAKVRAALRRALLNATQVYVDDAILSPLADGRVVNVYQKMFDPFVKSAASKHDRRVLTEAGTGVARGPVKATASKVRLDALGDETGGLALVAATFTIKVKATTPAGAVTIKRHTELTFANEFGKWVVTAYRVTVRRSIGARTTSAVAHSGAGATT